MEDQNYKINYGFMSDEDNKINDEDNNNDFTDVEMPGESQDPVEEGEKSDNNDGFNNEENEDKAPTEEKDDISYQFQSGPQDKVFDDEEINVEEENENNNEIDILDETNSPEETEHLPSYSENIEEENEKTEEKLSNHQAEIIKNILDKITAEIEQIRKILPGEAEVIGDEISTTPNTEAEDTNGSIVEGVFDGEGMVGSNGKHYDIPANYASKSKLVEGDILKLTITPDGSFLFKQIGPIERIRMVGTLAYDPTQGRYLVMGEGGKKWFILTASVTYFKGKPGDEAVILIPKSTPSRWAAVENIMPKSQNNNFGGNFNFN